MAIDLTIPSEAEPHVPVPLGRLQRLVDHPVATVFVLALLVRLALAVGSYLLMDGPLVPDEGQYVELADAVAHGDGAEALYPGYGRSLYRSTYAFSAPLARLFELFPSNRLPGSVLSAVLGAVTAGATVVLARRVVSTRRAMLAGLVVALLPSQVYWSSASIRESMVWASIAVAAAAVAFAFSGGRRALVGGLLVAALALLPLGWLRDQTLLAGVWSVFVAALLTPRRGWFGRVGGSFLLAALVPAVAQLGLGGIVLVAEKIPQLGSIRTFMSLSADSSTTPTTILVPATTQTTQRPTTTSTTTTTIFDDGSPSSPGGVGIQRPPTTTTTTTEPEPPPTTTTFTIPDGDVSVIATPSGEILLADESASASFHHLPRGLVGTLVRPYPWETTSSRGEVVAKVENVVWFALYALAILGAIAGRRRWRALGYPVVAIISIVVIAAVSQGNVGTAFRHRAQVLWALAVLAAVGLSALPRRRSTPEPPSGDVVDSPGERTPAPVG